MNLKNKKRYICVMLFCYISTMLCASGYIKKGETFVATEDVRYYTYEEALEIYKDKKKNENLENLKKQIAILKEIVANDEIIIAKHKKAAELDAIAITKYKAAIQKQESSNQDYELAIAKLKTTIAETKKSSVIYQEVVTTQTQALKNALMSIGHEKSKRRFERKFYYWLGVLTPIAIGTAANQIKIKF